MIQLFAAFTTVLLFIPLVSLLGVRNCLELGVELTCLAFVLKEAAGKMDMQKKLYQHCFILSRLNSRSSWFKGRLTIKGCSLSVFQEKGLNRGTW